VSELKVPTLATPAEVVCTDGRTFSGCIFVPVTSSTHDGPMRPEEVLNGGGEFFPFLPDAGGGTVILNKSEVLVVSVGRESDAAPGESPDIDRRVMVECPGRSIEGHLRIDMPSHHSRVLDYLNRPDWFLPVHDGGRVYLVRKHNIVQVREVREG
jgi:hypothetical protein